jgi:hypothetical protein
MRAVLLSLFFAFSALNAFAAEKLGPPLRQTHAHNDYEHVHPLWDALEQGFTSVEADIYLVDGQLLVAHELKDVKPERTLQKLYLQPLRELVAKNHGSVYPNGAKVTLLIDVKTDAEPTYAALKPILKGFSGMLTRFGKTKIETNAITVILSGNRPRETLLEEPDRLASYDGRLPDLGKGLAVSFMPLVSDSFAASFPSVKSGHLSPSDRRAFEDSIKQAHQEGRAIRFWATKDERETWKMLRDAGVDFINTDDLAGLAAFLRER